MNLSSSAPALLGVLAFVVIVYRQLRSMPVSGAGGARRPLVFGAVGLVLAGQYVAHHPVSATAVVGLVVSLVLAAGLAWLRARSVHLWRQEGVWWRRGTALTLVLWVCAIGSHLGIDALLGLLDPAEGLGRGLGNATLLLYAGVSLGLQHLVVVQRVAGYDRAGEVPTRAPSRLAG